MLRLVIVLVGLLPLLASAMTLNISTLYPDGTALVNGLRAASEQIQEQTDGRVSLRIYPGGVMGDDRAVQQRIRTGQLHGQVAQGGAFVSAYKDAQVLNLPLVFRDYDEVDAVRSELDPVIQQGLEEGGWVSFGLVDGGFAYLMSDKPVASVGDLRGQKVWLPANDSASARAARAFNISPIMLNIGSVMTSLQTGAIDAFAAPPVAALTLQWHSRVENMTDMPLLYTYGLMAIHQRHFRRLSAQDQQVVREVLAETFRALDASSREDNLRAYQAIQKQSLKPVTPDAEALAEWREYAQRATAELVKQGEISQAMIDRLNGILEQHRAAQ